MTHHHATVTTVTRCFSGPVARDERRAAHGNVCEIDTCICGATRATNVNGWHIEQGPWVAPAPTAPTAPTRPDPFGDLTVDADGYVVGPGQPGDVYAAYLAAPAGWRRAVEAFRMARRNGGAA